MTKKILLMAAVALIGATTSTALAQSSGGDAIYLGLHLNYETNKTDINGGGGETKRTTADILGGYRSSALYLGVIYTTIGEDLTVTGSTTNEKVNGAGVSVGYFPNEFFIIGHYYLTGEYSGGTKWKDGTGLGVDVGYLFPVTGAFHLGGAMAYRSLQYKGAETANSGQTFKWTNLSPRLLFSFLF